MISKQAVGCVQQIKGPVQALPLITLVENIVAALR